MHNSIRKTKKNSAINKKKGWQIDLPPLQEQ